MLGGLAGAISKYLEPQFVSVGTQADGQPTIVGVPLRGVQPAPVSVGQVQQQQPDAKLLNTIGAKKVDP